ncbi:invasion associated locus B family protein [Notoacmeibacter ruber]|uniref:invasion associated locus B family protein n=1 Tax=Notoacmeibacter ruber TaxID=2670375 RepID=UPI0018F32CA4|nr:invasion associated locus B family protein [Notoacmeibacter ruber]
MTLSFSRFQTTLFLLAGLLALAGPAPAGAQEGVVKETFGEWKLVCDTPAGASSEQCAIIQLVLDEEADIGLSAIVLRTADGKAELLRVVVPLGVVLPNGLGLLVDEKNIGNAQFTSCLADGCYAQVVLNDQLLETLKEGDSATFVVFKTPEEGIGVPIELDSFAEAYEALSAN